MELIRSANDKAELGRRELKKYAGELVQRVKAEAETQRYMVDRRMINQFLVNYLNPKSNSTTKLQMIDALSKILEFSNDERTLLGLKPVEKLFFAQSPQSATVNIADKLVKYLLEDD